MENKHEIERRIKYIVGESLMEYEILRDIRNQKSVHDQVPPTTGEFEQKYLNGVMFKRQVDQTTHHILKSIGQR